jgi:hypothetical protein
MTSDGATASARFRLILARHSTAAKEADFDADEGHQVYADPAGHPFCIGWGY